MNKVRTIRLAIRITIVAIFIWAGFRRTLQRSFVRSNLSGLFKLIIQSKRLDRRKFAVFAFYACSLQAGRCSAFRHHCSRCWLRSGQFMPSSCRAGLHCFIRQAAYHVSAMVEGLGRQSLGHTYQRSRWIMNRFRG